MTKVEICNLERRKPMFNKNEFNAMLARKGMTKGDLAHKLNMRRETLYRRICEEGNFSVSEIAILISIFGKDDVCRALFSC